MDKLIGLLFLARDLAHREHLLTDVYSHHVALGAFYEEVIERADELAEMAMGRFGKFDSIPFVENTFEGSIDDVLEEQSAWIEDERYKAADKTETALQNKIDEILGLYQRTLYLLRAFS